MHTHTLSLSLTHTHTHTHTKLHSALSALIGLELLFQETQLSSGLLQLEQISTVRPGDRDFDADISADGNYSLQG